MSEIVVESSPTETIIEFGDGTVVETNVSAEVQTIISTTPDPVIIDLNSGPRGEPGDKIYTGNGYPDPTTGAIGDLYVITGPPGSIGNVYRKTPTGWQDEGNIRGPAGGINQVNGYVGPDVILTKDDIGLDLVDNTADINKPVSGPTQTAIDAVDAALNLKADLDHDHVAADITDLGVLLDDKADLVHIHVITDVTGLSAALAGKESTIAAGTTAQYYRGDKSWQTLDKAAVGLSNVDNTSDANKPVSSATQTALNAKEPTIAAGTITQYLRGDKSWQTLDAAAVGLTNVVNVAQVTLTGDQSVAGIKTFTSSPVVPTPTLGTQAANKSYVDTAASSAVSSVIDAAPGTLDTLNELAAALGDDPNFAATITSSLATKVSLTGNETIAGVKTFSSAPVVPINSWTISDTSGLQTALDGKAAAVHGHALTDANITGILPFAQIPTGTTSTTVAIGNHTHSQYIDNSTTQNIGGVKTFTSKVEMDNGANMLRPDTAGTSVLLDIGVANGVAGGGYIDFHGGATFVDYDARISGTSGNGSNAGGVLTFYAANFSFNTGVISGNGSGLTTLNGTNISSGTVAPARLGSVVVRVVHGATSSTARPTGATYVEWFGSVAPTNATANDSWYNTV